MRNVSRIEKEINIWSDIEQKHNDVDVLFEFYQEEEISLNDLIAEVNKYNDVIEELELKMILGREEDMHRYFFVFVDSKIFKKLEY